eukprot:3590837-Rhodomonas_salina.1
MAVSAAAPGTSSGLASGLSVNTLRWRGGRHNSTQACTDIVRGSRREIFEKEWAYLPHSE